MLFCMIFRELRSFGNLELLQTTYILFGEKINKTKKWRSGLGMDIYIERMYVYL